MIKVVNLSSHAENTYHQMLGMVGWKIASTRQQVKIIVHTKYYTYLY